ncbi:MAG: 50S ribosomal protein L25 [Chlamydiae bacterium]|nr:50S ribosomal protein L25 [Chlamydiota bacterium]
MKLNIYHRTVERKSDVKKFRREGKIPAVLYVRGKPSEAIVVDTAEFEKVMRDLEQGRLSTTKFTLVSEDGKKRIGIVKDIQYHITSYEVIHLDFEELLDDVKVNVNVPIVCTGAADCVGIKLGGVLRQVIRHLRVQCLPKDLPEFFELEVKALQLNDARKLMDLEIPSAVRPLRSLNEVAVVIAKR